MPSNPIVVLALIALGFLGAKRLLAFLHLFQQEEYDNRRFLAWLKNTRAFDRRVSLALLAGGIIGAVMGGAKGQHITLGLGAAAAIFVAHYAPDPRKAGKKPLNMTKRARRLIEIAFGILAAFAALALWGLVYLAPTSFANALDAAVGIVLVQAIPLYLVAANWLLAPVERRINERFLREGREALARVKPVVIAITGSYGKTSTKHILAHILSSSIPTLATPGSINTPLGIARILREQLKPQHRYLVVEMGAYGIGSIARLCALTPPDFAAITAVGLAHHERFKSLDTVAEAKFEIADATIARGGRVVLEADAIPAALRLPRVAKAPASYALVGHSAAEIGPDGYLVSEPKQSEAGVEFTFAHRGASARVAAPIFGLHQVDNIALALALALSIGVPLETAVATLRSVPQIPHRLQINRKDGQATVIDDAYNANPVGFASALELLALLAGATRRRILVTPGMVELGDRHEEEHRRLGRLAGDVADVAIVIRAARIPSFLDGFEAGGREGRELERMASFAGAKTWLAENGRPDDVILFENDLPDLYEAKLKL
jgi:UDP-N-acetylmuramoyl-tripeptide--D-alanyl-D-alanine ligase